MSDFFMTMLDQPYFYDINGKPNKPKFKPLENYTWKEISDISKKGLASAYFKVGERKALNDTYTAIIVDFNKDEYIGDSGYKQTAGITFGISSFLRENLMVQKPLASSEIVQSYADITLGTTETFGKNKGESLLETFNIPSNIKDLIVPVRKSYTVIGDFSSEDYFKAWLFASSEIAFNSSYAYQYWQDLSGQYPAANDDIFNNNQLGQNEGDGFISTPWWTRSISEYEGPNYKPGYFLGIGTKNSSLTYATRTQQYYSTNISNYITFGFCI